ncbi:MAG TPA: transketolase [Candidatus Babeliales bacterium]|nr:transketolase [Candidatus Babeliales bacterium]
MNKSDLIPFLRHSAYQLRVDSLQATTQAGSGHPTSCLSAADIVAVLFFYAMHFDPKNHANPNNDRFILSKGHAAPLLYSVWKELGVLSEKELLMMRSFGSKLEGHPVPRFEWVDAPTGSLGQGLSIGLGMGLRAKKTNRSFYTYVLMGDSEVAEGSVWEAAELGNFYKLDNVIGIIDVNRLGQTAETIEGDKLEEHAKKWRAFGWNTHKIDGHSIDEIIKACDTSRIPNGQPTMILAHTFKGYGINEVENKNGFHGKAFKKDELLGLLDELKKRFAGDVQKPIYSWKPQLPEKSKHVSENKKINLEKPRYTIGQLIATRKAFGQALAAAGKHNDNIMSFDAEVKNSTFAEIFEKDFPDRFVQCFIAEQNMVGMAVGAQTRGAVPFVSTFGCFFTRAFDQLRMAAIGNCPLRLIGSHAGVSIGQDGPSQMALEDIAMMRSLPGSIVLYPCDAVSTWKLVELMANHHESISYLRTTRGETPVIYQADDKFEIGGCRILKQSENDQACIVAAGITVFEALKAYEALKKTGVYVSVIDLYSVKPLAEDVLKKVGKKSGGRIITVEDHYLSGGIGEAVCFALRNEDIAIECLAVTQLARSGKPEELLDFEKINAIAIEQCVKKLIK